MSRPTLDASKRTETGKSVNRKLRTAGKVPAVFYSKDGANIPVTIDDVDFLKLYRKVKFTQLFDLNIEGETKTSLIWTLQNEPVRGTTQHVDFFGVDMDKDISVMVPVRTEGIAPGVKLGGRMELYRDSLEVVCKPELIPSEIVIDISKMLLGDTVFVAEVDLGEGVKIDFDSNFALVRCVDKSKGKKDEDEEGEEE